MPSSLSVSRFFPPARYRLPSVPKKNKSCADGPQPDVRTYPSDLRPVSLSEHAVIGLQLHCYRGGIDACVVPDEGACRIQNSIDHTTSEVEPSGIVLTSSPLHLVHLHLVQLECLVLYGNPLLGPSCEDPTGETIENVSSPLP